MKMPPNQLLRSTQVAIAVPHSRLTSSDNFFVTFRGKIPIDDMKKRGHVFRSPVLIFEIIGVFPYVNTEQRLFALT
jgi:hypothetical protein